MSAQPDTDVIEALCVTTMQRVSYGRNTGIPTLEEEWPAEWTLDAHTVLAALAELDRRGVDGPLQVQGCRVIGQLWLPEAEVGRSVIFERCHFLSDVTAVGAALGTLAFTNCILPALYAQQVRLDRNCVLNGLQAEHVNLGGARINGQLAMRDARLRPGARFDGVALMADWIDVRGGVFCDHGFVSSGQLRLPFSRLGAQLSLNGARLEVPSDKALVAHGAQIAGSIDAGEGFVSYGEVYILRCTIGGDLALAGASLGATEGLSVSADGAVVRGSVLLDAPFSAVGQVRLSGAQIFGQLLADDAQIAQPIDPPVVLPDGIALAAEAMTVNDDCRLGIRARGDVRLNGSRFAGQVVLDGAVLDSAEQRYALAAQDVRVARTVSLEGATVRGVLSLNSSQVDDMLFFDNAQLGDCVIDAERARFGTLVARDWAEAPLALELAHARVDLLVDDPAQWPAARDLDGLVYGRLSGPTDIRTRLAWIHQGMDDFEPQVFDQLMAYYMSVGREEDARAVGIAKQKRRRLELPWPAKVWSYFLQVTIGFGYRAYRAVGWMVLFFLVGWAVLAGFWFLHDPSVKPTRSDGLPGFEPAAYALDMLLPVVDLGQERSYAIAGAARWVTWIWTLAGWVLTTAIAASLVRRFDRS